MISPIYLFSFSLQSIFIWWHFTFSQLHSAMSFVQEITCTVGQCHSANAFLVLLIRCILFKQITFQYGRYNLRRADHLDFLIWYQSQIKLHFHQRYSFSFTAKKRFDTKSHPHGSWNNSENLVYTTKSCI